MQASCIATQNSGHTSCLTSRMHMQVTKTGAKNAKSSVPTLPLVEPVATPPKTTRKALKK